MSTRTNTYVLYGVKLPYLFGRQDNDPEGDEWYQRWEPYLDNGYAETWAEKNGLTAIFDGMNGKWVFIGRVLARSGYDEFLENPVEMVLTETEKQLIQGLIHFALEKELAPGFAEIPEPQFWVFTHYH